ncbi:MAG TPA: polysaccharide deacetylase family protein [Bacteroidia bacterium]|nr:polysaccharide deacetylase family protein [Bacteroidia bacterium]
MLQAIFSSFIWRYEPSEKKSLYLTFDDGPEPQVTPFVLDILKQYKAKATFFCVGENVHKNPDLYKRILIEGHKTGNHSYNHLNGWKTKSENYINNIQKCALVVNSKLFRPPYGKITPKQAKLLRPFFKIVMWDVLSGDYSEQNSEMKCYENIANHASNGSIIVFHDSLKSKKNVLSVLPKTLEHFSKKGYSFLPVPD